MREFAIPDVVADPPATLTLADTVVRHARDTPDDVVFSRPTADGWEEVTAARFADDVWSIARGLVASGLAPGDRVVIMCATRYEWAMLDYAIWSAGLVGVPVYDTASSEQLGAILADSGAKAAFLETDAHLEAFETVTQGRRKAPVRWQISDGGLAALRAAGATVSDEDLAARRATRTSKDLATIVYTSGTTGAPRGCPITHEALWTTAVSAIRILQDLFRATNSTLLFLPLAHIFGRIIHCVCFESRVHVRHVPTTENLVTDLQAFDPSFLVAVPRVFEKVYDGYRRQARDTGKARLFARAEKTAVAYSRALDRGRVSFALRTERQVWERLLYARLRAPFGGAMRFAISGGAPLGERLGHFFRGIGILVLEGYGLTETTAAGAVNTVHHMRIGTVGQPSPGCTVRIAEADGEILLRGRPVFAGYWDAASSAAVRGAEFEDGWFHTGDIGDLDDDGYLRITGRKKEMVVTASGKNVAPAPLEERIRRHALVSQAMVLGDGEKFVAALVTLDPPALERWAAERGITGDPYAQPALTAEIQTAVDAANASVSHAEAIKAFRIVPEDFTVAAGTLTPSLKVRRDEVLARYGDLVASLYGR